MHGEGVVHGDLPPRNVLITERGLPVLVDFGLVARVGLASGREVLDKTRGAGSISYMAPEQIAGDLLDPRTDLYAVGVILYEALTGRVPFAGAVEEVIEQHRRRAPRPPSELADDVPDALDALVLHLLAKTPGDRVAYAIDVHTLRREPSCSARWPQSTAMPLSLAPGFSERSGRRWRTDGTSTAR